MRKKNDMLRGTLLDIARRVADTQGIDAVNIRSIAQEAGVASGTVYNYFSSKDEILLALTEVYWQHALLEMEASVTAGSFCGQVEEIFVFLRERIDYCAGTLMSSLRNVETAGRECMASAQESLKAELLWRLEQDKDVRPGLWNDTFSREDFAAFLVENLILLLGKRAGDINFLTELIRRLLY